MCGIVGFVANDPLKGGYNRAQYLSQGIVVDSLRGVGGTGICVVKNNLEILIFKKALPGFDYINSYVSELAFREVDNARVAIGHNRAATIGTVKDKNCHPFHYIAKREICLVHNGTLNNHHSLSPTGFMHEVDSAHAAMAMAEAEDIQKFLKKPKGPFVFVWWDGTDKTFNIARNEFREIYYIRAADGSIFFASEFKMLDWLLERNNIELPKTQLYQYPQDNQWLTWKIEDGKLSDKPKVREIKQEPEISRWGNKSYSARGYTPNDNSTNNNREEVREKFIRKFLSKTGLTRGDLVQVVIEDFEPYVEGYYSGNEENLYGKMICKATLEKDSPIVMIDQTVKTRYNYFKEKYENGLPVRILSARLRRTGEKELAITGEIRPKDLLELNKLRGENNDTKSVADAIKTIIENEFEKDEDEIIRTNEIKFVKGPGKTLIPETTFNEAVSRGCAYCSKIPLVSDSENITWIPGTAPSSFLCGMCAQDEEIRDVANVMENSEATKLN